MIIIKVMFDKLKIIIILLSFLLTSGFFVPNYLFAEDISSDKIYKIGVLAYKGKKAAVERWYAHGTLLSQKLFPLKFEVVPLSYKHNELSNAVINRQIDFVITNPGHYTELELGGHLSRMATRRMSGPQGVLDRFGGTAITHPERKDLNVYADLTGKKILIPSQSSLGGWQVHLREAIAQGIDLRQDAQIIELKNHKKVVDAIIAGEADAGFVRSDLIESLLAKDLLQLSQLKIINKRQESGYPYLLSTRLYPEWPFAAVTGTPSSLAKKVLQVLMNIQPDDKAAIEAKLFGWTIPGHYSSVIELFRETGLGPFKPKALTWKVITKHYWQEILLLTFLVVILLIFGIIKTLYTNKILFYEITKRKQIEQELVQHKQNLEQEVAERTTELENAQKEIIESEILLKNVIHGANLGFWDWHYQTQEHAVSDHWLEIIGLKRSDIINKPEDWSERIHQDDRNHVNKVIAESIKTDMPYRVEFRMKHNDGHWVWIEGSGSLVERDPNTNKPIRLCGTHQDISQRKKAEEALQESNDKFRTLVETTQDFIWEVTVDGVYIYCSPQVKDILGYEPSELLGKNVFDLMPAEEAKRVENIFTHLVKKRIPINAVENTNITKDGRKVILETSGQPFFSNTGELKGYRGIDRDISQRKQAEVKLKYMATHDALTGLYNRKVLEERLNDDLNRATRYKHSLSLFMLDIDHFKQINDTYGHQTGDVVLSNFAMIINESIRETDYTARYGGEEFVVVLLETPLAKAEEMAERLLNKIAEHSFIITDNKQLNITASIGVATFPEQAQSIQKLIYVADSAMYAAKKAGRNQVKTSKEFLV